MGLTTRFQEGKLHGSYFNNNNNNNNRIFQMNEKRTLHTCCDKRRAGPKGVSVSVHDYEREREGMREWEREREIERE